MLHIICSRPFITLFFLIFATGFSLPAAAIWSGYDKTWFYLDNWYGDWPDGFAVVRDNTMVPLHSMVMKDAKPDLACQLPRKAVYHVWNVDRNIMWATWVKMIPLKVAQGFQYQVFDRRGRAFDEVFHKGDTIEYITYESEQFALIRHNGVVMDIDHKFLRYIEDPSLVDKSKSDQWFYVVCLNGTSGWIKYSDVFSKRDGYHSGLDSWTLGLTGPTEVHDLKD